MSQHDARVPRIGTPSPRTAPASTSGDGTPERPEIRTGRVLSVERVRIADDYDTAAAEYGHANTSIAAALDVSESVVRRLRSAEKPLSLAHLSLGPAELFRRLIVRAAVRAFGVTGATSFFAECIANLSRRTT